MKIITTSNYKQLDPEVFYHGTDSDTSNHIDQHGWTTDRREKGIAPGAPKEERNLTFITPSRNAALWFATLGGSRKAGEYKVIPVRFTGKIYNVPGATSIYECAEQLGVATNERGLVWSDFVNKLKAAGYQAVSFHDRNAGPRGRPAVAVFDNSCLQPVNPKRVQAQKIGAIIKTASVIPIYRGVSVHNTNGNYWTTDKEWARQFTQSGQDKEIKQRTIDTNTIMKLDPLPHAVNEHECDAAIQKAKQAGFKAVWMDEGPGEPNSIYFV